MRLLNYDVIFIIRKKIRNNIESKEKYRENP